MMNKQEIEKAISLLKSDIGVLDNYLKKHPLVISHYLEKDRCIENQLIKDMEFTISVLEHQLANGWIPVSERLPDVHKRYLVSMKHKSLNDTFIDCRYYDPDYQFEYQDDFERYNWEVIAWQNLPKLYREIQEGDGENE